MKLLAHGRDEGHVAEAVMNQLIEASIVSLVMVRRLRNRDLGLWVVRFPISGCLASDTKIFCLPWIRVYFSVNLAGFSGS